LYFFSFSGGLRSGGGLRPDGDGIAGDVNDFGEVGGSDDDDVVVVVVRHHGAGEDGAEGSIKHLSTFEFFEFCLSAFCSLAGAFGILGFGENVGEEIKALFHDMKMGLKTC